MSSQMTLNQVRLIGSETLIIGMVESLRKWILVGTDVVTFL